MNPLKTLTYIFFSVFVVTVYTSPSSGNTASLIKQTGEWPRTTVFCMNDHSYTTIQVGSCITKKGRQRSLLLAFHIDGTYYQTDILNMADANLYPDKVENEIVRLTGEGGYINIISETFTKNSTIGSVHNVDVHSHISFQEEYKNCTLTVTAEAGVQLPFCSHF